MSVAIQISDFVGVFRIAFNPEKQAETITKIDQLEKGHIYRLFGYDLGERVIEHFTTNDTDIATLIAPFGFDECGKVVHSEGLKHYLLGKIYFDLINSERVQPSVQSGTAKKKNETGVNGVVNEKQLYENYNSAVRTAYAIQRYACKNSDKFPDFNGQKMLLNH